MKNIRRTGESAPLCPRETTGTDDTLPLSPISLEPYSSLSISINVNKLIDRSNVSNYEKTKKDCARQRKGTWMGRMRLKTNIRLYRGCQNTQELQKQRGGVETGIMTEWEMENGWKGEQSVIEFGGSDERGEREGQNTDRNGLTETDWDSPVNVKIEFYERLLSAILRVDQSQERFRWRQRCTRDLSLQQVAQDPA